MCALEASKLPPNPDLEELLAQRGFARETVPALLLLPLVHVAWADGSLEPAEADAIVELAAGSGLLPAEAAPQLREWIAERPDPEELDAQLELISLLLAAIGDELPVSVDDVEALATAVGKAAGGVFGLFFRLDPREKVALGAIRDKLGLRYGEQWNKTLAALRDDWRITDWIELDEPRDLGGLAPDDPLLFTDPRAVEQYDKGEMYGADGKPRSREDLIADLKIEVMRTEPWQKADLQLRKLLDLATERGLIEPAGVFWSSSPHGTVYRARAHLKLRIDGKLHRIEKGEQLVFICRMDREMMDLDGPFAAGDFSPTEEATLCGDMSGAMMGMGEMGMSGGMAGMPATGEMGMSGERQPPGPVPRLDVRKLQVDESRRVAYLLLDRSGSMKGDRLRMAKRAVMAFLQRIPANAGVRVVIRPFESAPDQPLLPLGIPFTGQARMALMGRMKGMRTGSATALFRAVELALDDVLRLADAERMTAPKTFLVVLSDGEDNQGIKGYRYRSHHGDRALFERVKDYREAGLLEYLPIAYGGRAAVRNLQQLGGPGFRIEITEPEQIIAKFGQIRARLMVGMPMGKMAGGMSGGMAGGGKM